MIEEAKSEKLGVISPNEVIFQRPNLIEYFDLGFLKWSMIVEKNFSHI